MSGPKFTDLNAALVSTALEEFHLKLGLYKKIEHHWDREVIKLELQRLGIYLTEEFFGDIRSVRELADKRKSVLRYFQEFKARCVLEDWEELLKWDGDLESYDKLESAFYSLLSEMKIVAGRHQVVLNFPKGRPVVTGSMKKKRHLPLIKKQIERTKILRQVYDDVFAETVVSGLNLDAFKRAAKRTGILPSRLRQWMKSVQYEPHPYFSPRIPPHPGV